MPIDGETASVCTLVREALAEIKHDHRGGGVEYSRCSRQFEFVDRIFRLRDYKTNGEEDEECPDIKKGGNSKYRRAQNEIRKLKTQITKLQPDPNAVYFRSRFMDGYVAVRHGRIAPHSENGKPNELYEYLVVALPKKHF